MHVKTQEDLKQLITGEKQDNEYTNDSFPYIRCYNCDRSLDTSLCGWPCFNGCELCTDKTVNPTYNNGFLPREYAKKTVSFANGKTFTPPNWKCFVCRDTNTQTTRIWIDSLVDHGCSDSGLHNMPQVDLPCVWCHKKDYDEQYNKHLEEHTRKNVDV